MYSLRQIAKKKLENIRITKLPRNCLTEICQTVTLRKVLVLDLGFNCLMKIHQNCFSLIYSINILNINDNHMNIVETGSFHSLSKLKKSSNPLVNLF